MINTKGTYNSLDNNIFLLINKENQDKQVAIYFNFRETMLD
uniref:Uncharacterized protein n=1 Tax=Setaria viridis TaxID=4556 RepID=A0A4V6D4W0_SETVI|nr:hypothetical protein SEVIR_6G000950v2 [Setaria viridis]